jgi:hypothetical protein
MTSVASCPGAGVDRLANLGSSRGADDYAKRARDGAHFAPRLGRQRAAGRHRARAGCHASPRQPHRVVPVDLNSPQNVDAPSRLVEMIPRITTKASDCGSAR